MAQITQHRNAELTVAARRAMVGLMLEGDWSVAATAPARRRSAMCANALAG